MKPFNKVNRQPSLQSVLYGWFVVVLWIPSLFLFFTEPMTVIEAVAFLTLPLGGYMSLCALFKKPGIPLWILFPFLVLGAFQLVLLYLFGESFIASDMFINLWTTNPGEAGELLDDMWPAVVGVCLLYLPPLVLGIVSIRRNQGLSKEFRKRAFGIGVALLAIGGIFVGIARQERVTYCLRYDLYPVNVLYNIYFSTAYNRCSLDYPDRIRDFKYHAVSQRDSLQREVVVLVIGETARADNFGIYGYSRETTPYLAKQTGLYIFRDAITQCNATHKSVPLLLSPASAADFSLLWQRKSILTAFKEAGFYTAFLSNHKPNRSYIDYFGQEADLYYNQKTERAQIESNPNDMELTKRVDSLLNTTHSKLFIVLHTYGSHFNYRERYPADQAYYLPDVIDDISERYRTQMVNAYDNTIRQTDLLLHTLIERLAESPQTLASLLYISDHGEDLMDDDRKRFLHASPIPTYYQLHVPLLLWLSTAYDSVYPHYGKEAVAHENSSVTSEVVFHTLLDLSGIDLSDLDSRKSLVSKEFREKDRQIINDHNLPCYLRDVRLKEQDEAAFLRVGMQFR